MRMMRNLEKFLLCRTTIAKKTAVKNKKRQRLCWLVTKCVDFRQRWFTFSLF